MTIKTLNYGNAASCPIDGNVLDEFGACAMCRSTANHRSKDFEKLSNYKNRTKPTVGKPVEMPRAGIVFLIAAIGLAVSCFNYCQRPAAQPVNKISARTK